MFSDVENEGTCVFTRGEEEDRAVCTGVSLGSVLAGMCCPMLLCLGEAVYAASCTRDLVCV